MYMYLFDFGAIDILYSMHGHAYISIDEHTCFTPARVLERLLTRADKVNSVNRMWRGHCGSSNDSKLNSSYCLFMAA